ncbi:MAG: hypothetical protein GY725_14535 [bacterium]|nr:hypothetical protein [bacterium]
MKLQITHPELFGVTADSITLYFDVEDESGLVDATARILLNGETRATCEGHAGTRHVRIEGLTPDTEYSIGIEVQGAEMPEPDNYFSPLARTLPGTSAKRVATFATINDLHFGEPKFGGTLLDDGNYGDDAPGFPSVQADGAAIPYWQLMNEDVVSEINRADVDMIFIKGDIADRGRTEQFENAARTFAGFEKPHHAFLGNHDHYALEVDQEVDGYALLNQPRAPRAVDLAGWRMILLDTVEPGEHHGVFPEERIKWLERQLEESRDLHTPTLLLMHHQPVPPEHVDSYPNSIGITPEHSLRFFDLLSRNPQVHGVLIGHTHRNRVRVDSRSGPVPLIEVHCVKDYPGGFAHYSLYDDGHFRQEARRTSTRRALAHSRHCRGFFNGGYRMFSLGSLRDRSFAVYPSA